MHHPVGHDTVEGEVGREHLDVVLEYQVLLLEEGLGHPDAHGLGLGRTGDDAAVVVGEDHHRPVPEPRVEHLLAGGIEAVAVHQGEDGSHVSLTKTQRRREYYNK